MFFAFADALNASDIGVAVNGKCEAGSCPAVPLPFNSTQTLPFDFTLTLPDGDRYLIYGSATGNNSSALPFGFDAPHLFQVTYEGNAAGGASAADTIIVGLCFAFQTTLGTIYVYRTGIVGAFGPTIAASSSVSSCLNVVLGCVGPFTPPGSFDVNSGYFYLSSTS
jgi:hypothetical protein